MPLHCPAYAVPIERLALGDGVGADVGDFRAAPPPDAAVSIERLALGASRRGNGAARHRPSRLVFALYPVRLCKGPHVILCCVTLQERLGKKR